ncbi:Glutamine-dependent NAD(+) synthetase [Aquicella siphonis]|uniref:Glutamine-dependent NAD(+) synthetase n=1 Tax=Aquicella siphonis TaxID=254247 RepID=A0A5E4PGU7_9COXI|nr:NAD+ synthase [Aquicella siphonis]VVC76104.1 Glutamine-dependent NAD(+) synthetase [Aquicella siphonis]
MSKKIRIVLAQLNLTVGDISGNLEKHVRAAHDARDKLSADMIVFPELSLIGYPCEDLLLRKAFIDDARKALHQIKATVKNIYCLVGHPYTDHHRLFNSCSLIFNGRILSRYDKQRLPNYGVFDECRYFTPGTRTCVQTVEGISAGLVICEDLWKIGPVQDAATQGAQIIISPNASPFEIDKHEQRVAVMGKRAAQHRLPIVYVNQVGGQDDLIFDGGSMVINAQGHLCQFAGFFNETLLPVDLTLDAAPQVSASKISISSHEERVYQALVLGVRDYVNKNHFNGVLVGVSGGIDSALTLAVAVDALGKERVHAVMMPSRYTSKISTEDSLTLINNLGVSSETLSIESVYESFLASLSQSFADKKPDITEENIQARCRAVILMALSNKHGHLVLTTGNRSEIAVGYCTLYGDMAGGFAVLKDVPKTLVYKLAAYRNQQHPVIPARTLERPPTAELAPDQKDEDTLPPYPVLDRILECYLNQSQSLEEIIDQGFDSRTVHQVVAMIKKNEYKRRQAAIGPRINHKSFGKDWRYPVTNGFKG